MSDFMKWLYLHYIRPHLERQPGGEYETQLDALGGELSREQLQDWEFIALHAFALGLRTGAGLEESFHC